MRPDLRKVDKPVDLAKQVIVRNMPLKAEAVEQRLLKTKFVPKSAPLFYFVFAGGGRWSVDRLVLKTDKRPAHRENQNCLACCMAVDEATLSVTAFFGRLRSNTRDRASEARQAQQYRQAFVAAET
jgi:hypothetical protein